MIFLNIFDFSIKKPKFIKKTNGFRQKPLVFLMNFGFSSEKPKNLKKNQKTLRKTKKKQKNQCFGNYDWFRGGGRAPPIHFQEFDFQHSF